MLPNYTKIGRSEKKDRSNVDISIRVPSFYRKLPKLLTLLECDNQVNYPHRNSE